MMTNFISSFELCFSDLGIFLVHTIEMDTSYVHVYLSQRLSVDTIRVTIDSFVSLDHNVTNDEVH